MAGNKEGNGEGRKSNGYDNKEVKGGKSNGGGYEDGKEEGRCLQQQGWQASNGSNNGDVDGNKVGNGDGNKVAGKKEGIGEGVKSDGYGNKGGGQATAATIAMRMGVGVYISYAESDNLQVDVLPAGSLQIDVLLACRQTAS